MKLHRNGFADVTIISNTFIDQYMSGANGEFVKVYLYLLRSEGREMTLSSIADALGHTDNDIRRALKYWEQTGLLTCTLGKDGEMEEISITDTPSVASAPKPEAVHTAIVRETEVPKEEPKRSIPSKSALSPARQSDLADQDDIRQLVFVGEQYLGRPLSNQELTDVLYFYDTLHFSVDLIEYLFEYCAEKKDPGIRYMEKVAQSWYAEGISSPEEAKTSSRRYNADYYTIFRAFGISDRKPALSEMDIMDKWFREFALPIPVIEEACKRAILKLGRPDFRYADGILTSWNRDSVRSLEDVARLDAAHGKAASGAKPKASAAPSRGRSTSSSGSRFGNFKQREYDWDALSAQLTATPEGSSS